MAISHADGLIFNTGPSEFPRRLLMWLLAITVGVVLVGAATRRGLGRQWGVWIGCALLVAVVVYARERLVGRRP